MRFEVGELARYVVARTVAGLPHIGQVVEILEVNPRRGSFTLGRMAMEDADYSARFSEDAVGTFMDYQLQKLNPPEEPVEMTFHEEVEA